MYLPLNRHWSKIVALVFIAIGMVLAPDVIPPPMTDWINPILAAPLADYLQVTFIEALVITYIFAFLLIALGLLIFPYNTKRLLVGKMKAAFKFIRSNPLIFIGMVILMFIVMMLGQWFYDNLWEYAKQIAMGVT